MSPSIIGPYDQGPCKWVKAAAGQTRYPTDDQGGGTATAASSRTVGKQVSLSHIVITSDVNAGDVVEVVDDAGTALAGLSFTLDTGQKVIPLNAEIIVAAATATAIGLKATNCDATLFYR